MKTKLSILLVGIGLIVACASLAFVNWKQKGLLKQLQVEVEELRQQKNSFPSEKGSILPPVGGDGVICPMDAKLCPDGTSVGRTGPRCEFAPCPGAK